MNTCIIFELGKLPTPYSLIKAIRNKDIQSSFIVEQMGLSDSYISSLKTGKLKRIYYKRYLQLLALSVAIDDTGKFDKLSYETACNVIYDKKN